MSDDYWYQPWSNKPHAPQIARYEYIEEKSTLAGSFVGSILYGAPAPHPHICPFVLISTVRFILGLVIMLFFQCIAALLNPIHRRGEGIKWWLVSHTVAMFSFVTVYTATNLQIQSNSFVDNREGYSATITISYSAPLEYQANVRKTALGLIPNTMFSLNNLLADGLLVSSLFNAAPTRPDV